MFLTASPDGHPKNDSDGIFPQLLTVIGDSVAFLDDHCGSRTYSEISDCTAEANHIGQRLDSLRAERPDLIRVLVMGEFKAGKSTLINALVGREVAATDVFEMTTVVCRIIPTHGEGEQVVLAAPNTGLPTKYMTIEAFLGYSIQQAQSLRGLEQSETLRYTHADLHIATDLRLEIMDTPGLGATLKNELNALDAINTCDVILWVVNSQNIGGARESAMLEKIQERDQPLLCVVTKIDALSPEEAETVADYVLDDYEVPKERLFLVSAKRVMDGQGDPGMKRLNTYLHTQIAPVGAHLREQALIAQATDVGVEIGLTMRQVDESLAEAITRNAEVKESFLATANVITQDVALELSNKVRQQLRASLSSIFDQTRGDSDNGRKTVILGEIEIQQTVEAAIKNIDMNDIAKKLQLEERYENLWIEGLQSEISMMVSGLASVEQEANQEAMRVAEELTRDKINQAEQKKLALQSVLEMMEKIVNESNSIFHFGIALIHKIPILIKNFVAARQERVDGTDTSLLKNAFSEWVDETVDGLVATSFTSAFAERNRKVAMEAADRYALQQEEWPASLDELYRVRTRCRDHYEQLAVLVTLDNLPPLEELDSNSHSHANAYKNVFASDPTLNVGWSGEDAIRELKRKVQNAQTDVSIPTKRAAKTETDGIDRLIGLQSVKNDIRELEAYVTIQQQRQQQGLHGSPLNLHMVFTGNPGTGKTSVARMLGQIYREMGLLSQGHIVEVGRADLIASYLGQTAPKVQEAVKRSFGGILFIDEAYSLTQDSHGGDSYSTEAIDTLLAMMENHREEFVVIVAGYTAPMEGFIASNPGLKSRFARTLHFDDYSATDLGQIFEKFARDGDYCVSEEARAKLFKTFEKLYAERDAHFGNGRLVRNLFESAKLRHGRRVAALPVTERNRVGVLETLQPDDIPEKD
jgi:GTPase Era involved in 16S rRNA processing/Holliday junction resolvasome RuvABC ATP-dependent DNA helicase subunit